MAWRKENVSNIKHGFQEKKVKSAKKLLLDFSLYQKAHKQLIMISALKYTSMTILRAFNLIELNLKSLNN